MRLGGAGLRIDQEIPRLDVRLNLLAEAHNRHAFAGHKWQHVEEVNDDVLAARIDRPAGVEPACRQREFRGRGLRGRKPRIGFAGVKRVANDMIHRGAAKILHVVEIGGLQLLPIAVDDGAFHASNLC